MSYTDPFRYAYQQDYDDYFNVSKPFTISDDKKTITTYYNDTNYEHDYTDDYSSISTPYEHGILRLRFEAYDLSKNQYKFGVDGHGYMFGFSPRGNDGTAGHQLHAKMPIGTNTSGMPWWQLSVGSNGYWQIATYTTYGSWDGRITGYERIQSYIYPYHGIAATEVFPSGNGIESLAEGNTGILLYMETECNHYIDTVTHTPGKSATCSTPGIRENWYCSDCETYYADEDMTTVIGVEDVLITPPAHSNSCGCAAETAKFELCLDPPNGSNQSGERYLLLAKAGDKYYAMGNVTNADGSRNAVEVIPNANGVITASSNQEEFMTYYWPSSGPVGFLVDNGYLSMQNGRILAYEQSLYDFNKFIPDQADFYLKSSYDETGLGSFRVYSSVSKAYEYIVFDEENLCFRAQSTENDSTYLYKELCSHEKEHYSGVEATCTRCGSREYWYCDTCYRYFGDAAGETSLEWNQLNTHATGHNYQNGACANCGKNVPIYTKVTSEDQLGLPGTYIIVATDGASTYVLQEPINTEADLNNNRTPDLYEIDVNGNGTPDVYEEGFYSDSDGDGEADIIDYDYEAPHVIPVKPDDNGSITVAGLGAAEFEMIPANYGYGEGGEPMPEALEEGGDWLGDEESGDMPVYDDSIDRYFLWMPNGLLNGQNHPNTRFTCFINGEGLTRADETSAWEISLGNGLTAEDATDLASAKYAVSDETAIMFFESAINALRLRKYNDAFSFVSIWDGYLLGATEIRDEENNVIGYNTHDSQYGVYLYYAPDIGTHTHAWSNWEKVDDNTHSRTCSVSGCTVGTQTAAHAWGNGVVTTEPTETTEGVKTYTCSGCGATKTEAVPATGHTHVWSDWEKVDDTNHSRTCSVNGCTVGTETAAHTWNNGVITTQPTEDAEGVKTYTCTATGCGATKTEAVPMLEHTHTWGDWAQNDEDTHIRRCTKQGCTATETDDHTWNGGDVTQAPNCGVPGEAVYTCTIDTCNYEKRTEIPALEHEWSNWEKVDETNHKRICANPECPVKTETAAHTFGDWVIQDDGSLKRTCTAVACDAYETLAVNAPTGEILVDNKTTPTTNDAAADLLIEDPADIINDILTEEDVEKVQEGAAISVYLQVEDISNTVAPTEAAAASGAAAEKGAQIGMYLDIDLFKAVTASGSTVETQVTETNNEVTITIQVPDELINTDPNVTRVYSIVRVHDGWAEIIYGEFDPATKTLTFQTDKFSTYALAYADTSTPVYDPYIPAPATYPVSTAPATNGAVKVNYTNVVAGATVTITVEPRTGYTLETLAVLDQLGRQIPVTNVGGGKYTFRMPAGGVTVVPTFMEDNTMLNFFMDVKAGDYYYDAVLWAAVNGITKGDTAVTFAPDKACTRAQMVTFLWRAAGCPEPTGTAKGFADVTADSYYGKAVLWAVEQGITNGTGDTTFSPDATCTRAQMAAFLCRLAGGKAVGTGAGFTDVKADAYYAEAVRWAAENGITNGTGDGTTFSPDATCTRGQMVTFLYRYFVK